MKDEENKFDLLIKEEKDFILGILGGYHYRNGLRHKDGSMGTIKISPKEFRDCLAHVLRGGF